jgi:hypothetical protein
MKIECPVAVTSPNRLTALMALAFALAASAPAAARDACPDPDARFATLTFDLKILKQPVAVAVDVISKQAGTTAVLDKSLARDIERLELRGSLREAMDTLSQRADLVWCEFRRNSWPVERRRCAVCAGVKPGHWLGSELFRIGGAEPEDVRRGDVRGSSALCFA